jgi:Fe2+ or Zn2+ uptake regulation protein
MRRETYNEFRRLCQKHSLAATHQRQKIYEALVSRPGHYSPEEIYEQVKQDLPSISLATVYKNLKTFVHAGMLREVSRPVAHRRQPPTPSSPGLHALPIHNRFGLRFPGSRSPALTGK